jgi:hypothetical protein
MNFDNYKFRASCVGKIMTNGRVKDEMGETAKSYLKQIIREVKWKRQEDIDTKQMRKGNVCEDDSITLYNIYRVIKKNKPTCGIFRKNKVNLTNSFVSGTLDITDTNDTDTAAEIVDIKSSYDWTTFPYKSDKIDAIYEWQLQTYLSLVSTAKKAILAHCLVNLDREAYLDLQKSLSYRLGDLNGVSDEYKKACIKLEKRFIYDMDLFVKENQDIEIFSDLDTFPNIPEIERVREVIIKRDDAAIECMHARVIECRNWMNENWDKV